MNQYLKFNPLQSTIFSAILFLCFTPLQYAQQSPQLVNYSASKEHSSYLQGIIIDSNYSLEEALNGISIPTSVKNDLELVTVKYYGFDDRLHQGQLIVNKKIADDIKEIFEIIEEIKFPIEKVVPMSEYSWSDEKSMDDNNTCSFNYRFISGTRIISMHASGLAIDINPRQNPYIKNGNCIPAGTAYKEEVKGTIKPNSELVKAFKERGWTWGGDWKSLKDYQHFQKELK
jgi:peptidoglycan LD-endopeptidase CwlK